MNLTSDPWIPVRMTDGSSSLLSLNDLFVQSSSIADLSLAPHERISVMRLLICITQAAIGFPEHDEDWDGFGENLETKVPVYLKEWKDSFELFGEGKRFLQTNLPASEKSYDLDQMIYTQASGNTPTVLDHRSIESSTDRCRLALIILTYQNFFVGGSMAKKIKGNGPSLKALHTFIQGDNLKSTLLFNCLDEEMCTLPIGRPLWEKPENVDNATMTYLGRLVPTPCKIWISNKLQTVQLDQGFKYPEFDEITPESSVTTTVWMNKGKENPRLLRANTNRGIWRDLHALTVLKKSETSFSEAPLIIQSHYNQFNGSSNMPIWCGELIKAKDAKILDAVESTFHLPLSLFKETGRNLYDKGVQHADYRSKSLADAVRAYGKSMYIDKPDTSLALRHYWHSLDQQAEKLLEVIQNQALLDKGNFGSSSDPWSKAVYFATVNAYEATCPRNTPRQIQAYATGLNKLFPKKAIAKKTAKKKKKTPQSNEAKPTQQELAL